MITVGFTEGFIVSDIKMKGKISNQALWQKNGIRMSSLVKMPKAKITTKKVYKFSLCGEDRSLVLKYYIQ